MDLVVQGIEPLNVKNGQPNAIEETEENSWEGMKGR